MLYAPYVLTVLCFQRIVVCNWCVNIVVKTWTVGYMLFHVLLKSCGSSFLSLHFQNGKVKAWRGEAAAACCYYSSEETASALCSYECRDISLFLLMELVLGSPLTEVVCCSVLFIWGLASWQALSTEWGTQRAKHVNLGSLRSRVPGAGGGGGSYKGFLFFLFGFLLCMEQNWDIHGKLCCMPTLQEKVRPF